ncbi:VOC family protein [Mitsuaria sp. GD03876]|uniref:VOC family protein n=1 Tax=Mitsuaria sp. GD03876 TaxID=2975399 RepID=UPI00244A7F84|nr:VOC family protein [Mitsuaria sp. GD03876]MDH0863873.1 VOC family protein [Mitsuaria sp. GD03876]
MLHHLSFGVASLARSVRMYDGALAALGLRRVYEDDTAIGYGVEDGEDVFCVKQRPDAAPPGPGFHLAFSAPSRAAVDAFHTAAIAAGGTDNGAPGLRPHYGPTYYAAFVVDPDGHRVEAVFKGAE